MVHLRTQPDEWCRLEMEPAPFFFRHTASHGLAEDALDGSFGGRMRSLESHCLLLFRNIPHRLRLHEICLDADGLHSTLD